MRNPYSVLGLKSGATQAEIKKKYRSLAKELHPDRHPGNAKADERFKEVGAAYALLGDAKQRGRFDRGEIDAEGRERVHAGFQRAWRAGEAPNRAFRKAPGAEPFGFGFRFEDLVSPLFRDRGRPGPQAAPDLAADLDVTFLEAARGAKKRVPIDGRRIDVAVPAGIENGQTIRLRGQAPGPQAGTTGDLHIRVNVAPDAQFSRKGDDIHLDLPISLAEAVQGAKVDVPTIHGNVSLTVPKGSNSGRTLRLRGKGIRPQGDRAPGDQYVRLQVSLPDEVDAELTDFVARWSAQHDYDPRRKPKG